MSKSFLSNSQLHFSVLISLGNSSGSGFLYISEKHLYLVTAKHVIFKEPSELYSSEIEITCQIVRSSNVNRFRIDLTKTVCELHTKNDVAVVKIGSIDEIKSDGGGLWTMAKGVEHLETGDGNPITVKKDNTKLFEEVLISNEAFVFGYPTSLGLRVSPQFNLTKPLLRKGIIAGVNDTNKTIILDCPVYAGNSGGPVMQVEILNDKRKLFLIGIVSQYIPYVQKWINHRDGITHEEHLNSGYSVVTSFDPILELIESMEQEPES